MGNTKKKINYLRQRKIKKKRKGNRVQKGRGLENMTEKYIEYLKKKYDSSQKISNSILKAHSIPSTHVGFNKPSTYVLNKLNLLYSINDDIKIEPNALKGVADDTKKDNVKNVITQTEQFINEELPKFDINLERTFLVIYHGHVLDYMHTVPKDVILVFIAPTNREVIQDVEHLKSICNNITDIKFLEEYIKNPNCLHVFNKCFLYAHICYPGQSFFDIKLSHLESTQQLFNYTGVIKGNDIKGGLERGSFVGLTLPRHEMILSKLIDKPGIYFINICRGCNLYLNDYLVESLYYHENMLNYINKFNKNNTCSLTQKEPTCYGFFSKKQYKTIGDEFPKFDMSPLYVANNKFNATMEQLLLYFFSKDEKKSIASFFRPMKHVINHFFITLMNLNQYYNEMVKPNNDIYFNSLNILFYNTLDDWYSFIDNNLFNTDGTLVNGEVLPNIFNVLNNENDINKNILLRLLLAEIIFYYLKTNNVKRQYTLEYTFANNDVLNLGAYMISKISIQLSIKHVSFLKDLFKTKLSNFYQKNNNNNNYNYDDTNKFSKEDYGVKTLDYYYIKLKQLYNYDLHMYYYNRAQYCIALLNNESDDVKPILNDLIRHQGSFFKLLTQIDEFIKTIDMKFNSKSIFYKLFTVDNDKIWDDFVSRLFNVNENIVTLYNHLLKRSYIASTDCFQILMIHKIIKHINISGITEENKQRIYSTYKVDAIFEKLLKTE
jgi:hypothetical protein